MAKINPVKLKQDAEKLEITGRPDQAVVLYRQILEENPRDWNVINKIGDIYAKMNRVREAGEEYAKVADFYAKDGFLLKAIAIWKKINRLDASALEPYQNLAELYAKQGLLMEAKGQYQVVVDELIKRGRTREAGDVLKKMAEVDPGDLKIRSKLADLYTREGHTDKAVEEHVAIAEELNKKGHLAEALQVLEKGLKIAPKSLRLRMELGRVHLIQKNFDKASQHLEEAARHAPTDTRLLNRLGEAYLGAKRIEEAEAVFKRLLELNPGDEEARIQMGRLCLLQERFDAAFEEFLPAIERLVTRHEGDKAAALLQQIVQKAPSHVKSLQKLLEVYQAFKKEAAALATYSQLTEAYLNQGRFNEAASVLELLVSREPSNQQHQTKLEFVKSRMSGARGHAPAAAPAAPAPDFLDEEFDLGQPESEPPPSFTGAPPARPATPAPRPRPAIEVSGPLSDDDREFVDEHLAEGRVFRKYGLVDKAADQFEAIVARFPDNVDARQELRDLHKERDDIPKAVEQCLALAEILRLRGDQKGALAHEDEARRLLPEAAEALPVVPRGRAREEAPRAGPAQRRPALPVEEEEIALEGEEVALEGFGSEVSLEGGPLESFSLDEEEVAFEGEFGQHFLDEEPALVEETPSPPEVTTFPETPSLPEKAIVLPPMDDELPLGLVLEAESPDQEEAPGAAAPAGGVTRPEVGVPEVPASLRKVLDEVDDYIALGFVEDAKEALREIAARHPGDPAIFAKIAELGLEVEGLGVTEVVMSAVDEEAEEQELGGLDLAFDGAPEEPAPPVEAAKASRGREAEEELDLAGIEALEIEEQPVEAEIELTPTPPAFEAEPEPVAVEDEASLAEEPQVLGVVLPGEELPGEADREEESELSFEESPLLLATDAEAEDGELEIALPGDEEELEPVFAGEPEAEGAERMASVGAPSKDAAGGVLDDAGLFDIEGVAEVQAVDLASELDDLFGTQTAVEEVPQETGGTELGDLGLADIFKEFKKGVDKQLSQEDYDTRYNLGIAYKEMGLLDEAIAEFQLAAKDPNRLLECSSMLGICFMDKGMPKLAVKWFERGLGAPGRTDEEYLGLRYDLAAAHEAAGDTGTALGIYTELYGQDANFRDVAAKVRELRAARMSG